MCGCASTGSCSRHRRDHGPHPGRRLLTRSASSPRSLADSPSLCTPTFIANVRKAIAESLYLKRVTGRRTPTASQYCDALGQRQRLFAAVAGSLAIPGHTETVARRHARRARRPRCSRSRRPFGDDPAGLGLRAGGVERRQGAAQPAFKPAAMVRISLTNGTPVMVAGDPSPSTAQGRRLHLGRRLRRRAADPRRGGGAVRGGARPTMPTST